MATDLLIQVYMGLTMKDWKTAQNVQGSYREHQSCQKKKYRNTENLLFT